MTEQTDSMTTVADQAADWLVRLQSDDVPDTALAEFCAWLEAGPEHQAAFAAAEAMWVDLDIFAEPISRALDKPQPVVASASAPLHTPRRRFAGWAPVAGAGLAMAMAMAIAAVVIVRTTDTPELTFQTAKGQTRVAALADGSHVTLNSGSLIHVRLERGVRRVELAQGEAAFDVAKDPGRPFVVAAGDRRVQVVGTEFNVLRHDGEVQVTVRRGIVEVIPVSATSADPAVRLTPGQQLSHREGETVTTVNAVDPAIAFAWTGGDLIYHDQRLDEVAADLSRYFAKPVRVEGPAAALKFTGVLKLDEEGVVVRRLQAFLPIAADWSSQDVTLRLRAPGG